MDNATVSNVFGTLGAVCWSVQLTPQIILNYRRHSAAGLSPAFMLFWAWAGIPLGIYNITSKINVSLQVQPQILSSLSLITWGQCFYYERGWSAGKVIACVLSAGCVMGGIEAALVVALRIGVKNGTEWPLILMAVLAALLLALGVMEQYLAIWKSRGVEGISFLFCLIDALGDVTSIVSVVFEPTVSILGLVMYGVEFVLWVGVFACGFYFKFVPWMNRRAKNGKRGLEASPSDTNPIGHELSLQELPSSTSVFQVASGRTELRSRGPAVSSGDS